MKFDESGGYDSRIGAAIKAGQMKMSQVPGAVRKGVAAEVAKSAPGEKPSKAAGKPTGYKYPKGAADQVKKALPGVAAAISRRARKPGLKMGAARLVDNDNPTNPQAQGYGGGGIQ